uniref:Ubiquinol oxidase n=1 Tax=Populus alba TaxID=43335 RepID=A0A4V6A2I9_POPAL|nr:hypothetical protein D5086_0000274840 [Populus alba]
MMARREGASKLVSSMMLVSRSFSTATARGIVAKEAVPAKAVGFNGDVVSRNIGEFWVRGSVFGLRHGSTASYSGKEQQQEEVKHSQPVAEGGDKAEEKHAIVSYWGVPPSRVTKEDGTEWKWNCFRPWETYSADLSINLTKHHAPVTFLDKMAYWTVKSLRWPTDLFFQRRYGCRAMMLETVAAVPGMVGGMLLHCKSLRRFEHSGGWIKTLLDEAENERMHLMTFMEVAKPRWYERALVITVQGVFFNAYFLGYLISPKFAHRMVGYLEEEAIHSYTEFLKELDKGNIKNVPAPAIAIDYWRLPPNSTLRDVVEVVRADEAHHRDVNHFASDIHYQGRELKEAPAPIEWLRLRTIAVRTMFYSAVKFMLQSPQETQNPPAATPLYCESSLELSWNHLIYDYKAYQTTSFEFKALPLPLSSYQSMISTADAVLTPENGHSLDQMMTRSAEAGGRDLPVTTPKCFKDSDLRNKTTMPGP